MTAAPHLASPTGPPGDEQGAAETIWAELADAAGAVNRAHARLVDVTSRAIASGAWFGAGIQSVEHWLVLRAGLDRGRARVIVRLAKRYDELPTTAAELTAGQLSLEQAAAVARHTPAHYERGVAEMALSATVPQIVRATAQYAFAPADPATPDADQADEPAACERPASLRMGTGADGRFRLRYDAPAHIGALVEAAIREAKDRLFRDRHGDAEDADAEGAAATAEPPVTTYTHEVTLADALADVCATAVEARSARRRDRYRVLVHLGTEGAWLSGGPRLPDSILERLTCDGVLRPVWETEGAPVNVGRSQRVVPDRTKALLRDRDRGCRFPSCRSAGVTGSHVEAHHIVPWLRGGRTDTDNLLSLCPWHHDRHHDGEFRITGNPDLPDHDPGRVRFWRPGGTEIALPRRRPDLRLVGDGEEPAATPYRGPTGQPLETRWVDHWSDADYAAFEARPDIGGVPRAAGPEPHPPSS